MLLDDNEIEFPTSQNTLVNQLSCINLKSETKKEISIINQSILIQQKKIEAEDNIGQG